MKQTLNVMAAFKSVTVTEISVYRRTNKQKKIKISVLDCIAFKNPATKAFLTYLTCIESYHSRFYYMH